MSCLNLFSPLQPECRSGQSVLIMYLLETLQCPQPHHPGIHSGRASNLPYHLLRASRSRHCLSRPPSLGPLQPNGTPFRSPNVACFVLTSRLFHLLFLLSATLPLTLFFLANSYLFFRSQFSSRFLRQYLPDLQD